MALFILVSSSGQKLEPKTPIFRTSLYSALYILLIVFFCIFIRIIVLSIVKLYTLVAYCTRAKVHRSRDLCTFCSTWPWRQQGRDRSSSWRGMSRAPLPKYLFIWRFFLFFTSKTYLKLRYFVNSIREHVKKRINVRYMVLLLYVVYNSRLFNDFNNCSVWSIIVGATLRKCAHRTPAGVRERQTCIGLMKSTNFMW
jgi:hypothetical protein